MGINLGFIVKNTFSNQLRKKKRIPGLLKGKIKIHKDFDKLPKSFLKYFEIDTKESK